MTLMLHRAVKHSRKDQSANLYVLKGNKDIDVKQRQLQKRRKQGKYVFDRSPPRIGRFHPKFGMRPFESKS